MNEWFYRLLFFALFVKYLLISSTHKYKPPIVTPNLSSRCNCLLPGRHEHVALCKKKRYKHTENRIRILTGAPEFFCGHSSRHDLKADNRFTLQTIIITQAIFKFHCYLAVYHSLPKVFKDNK